MSHAEAADDPASIAAVPSARELAMLDFERQWRTQAGAKEDAIRREFGVSAARYYQLLNALIDTPAAVMHDPMLVRRLQRMRDTRRSARAARTGRGPRADPPRID